MRKVTSTFLTNPLYDLIMILSPATSAVNLFCHKKLVAMVAHIIQEV